MFYVFSYTPDGDDSEAAPYELKMPLAAGVIHQVDVLFQDGCQHKTFVQIELANQQLWPSNRGENLRGNATVISFREFYDLSPGGTILTAKIWTTLTEDFKEILINVGVLPKKILQPLSFDELLSAAAGLK